MNILKGFVNIQHLLSNVPGVVSPIGELSAWGGTYTRETGEYTDADVPGYRLVSVYSADTALGLTEVNPGLVKLALTLAKNALTFAVNRPRPYNLGDFMTFMQTEMYGKAVGIEFGDFIYNDQIGLPGWISCASADGNSILKIWLADSAFVNQYDEYTITVVPPLSDLDVFFTNPSSVRQILESVTVPEMMEKIQEAKGQKPETYLRSFDFNYAHPNSPNNIVKTTWTVLINGVAGDNIDTIKDAIVAYVLQRSSNDRASWELIIPELFKRTEFVVLPRWDLMSIPNLTVRGGLYGSMMNPFEAVEFAKQYIDFYTDEHIQNNLTLLPFDYKALMLEIVNGATNIEGRTRITEMFPDYIPVPTTSLDFNRMQMYTQKWVALMADVILAAETATQYTALRGGMRKVYRDGKLYLSVIYDNVNYLVAVKSSYALPT